MGRNRWQSEEGFEVPLTPLIDIIFILIVFFLVATTFYSEERDLNVQLPEGSEGEAIVREQDMYVINIRESGLIVVGSRILNMAELREDLMSAREGPQTRVEIRGDTNARHGQIMAIMNLCKQLKISDYALTQRIVKQIE